MNKCEHRWKTRKFIEENNEWTHYMECIKCGAHKTITYQEKAKDKNKTE